MSPKQAKGKKRHKTGTETKPRPKGIGTKLKRLAPFGAAAVALVVGYLIYSAATTGVPGVPVPDIGNEHIPSIDSPHRVYSSDPPTSGPHVTGLANWGIHSSPIPRELQVHNLEDGGVLVQHNCRDCQELIAKLTGIVKGYDRAILAPYPGMEDLIALTAWGRIDRLNSFDEKRIRKFIEAFMGIDHHRGS